jgi:hypothetical protein
VPIKSPGKKPHVWKQPNKRPQGWIVCGKSKRKLSALNKKTGNKRHATRQQGKQQKMNE